MTTPIERAVAELTRLDLCLPVRDRRPTVRAVFESIDREGLARLMRQTADETENNATEHEYADTIIAYLTGDPS